MATQTAFTQRGKPGDAKLTIETDLFPIADDFDLALPNLDLYPRVQIGVQMADGGGAPAVAGAGTFDVSAGTPNINQLEQVGTTDATAPKTETTLGIGIDRVRVVPNGVSGGAATQYRVVVTLYLD